MWHDEQIAHLARCAGTGPSNEGSAFGSPRAESTAASVRRQTARLITGSACYAGDLSGHFDEPLWLPIDGVGGLEMTLFDPCLIRSRGPSRELVVRLGMPLVDDYLEFLEGRCRPNTVLAAAPEL